MDTNMNTIHGIVGCPALQNGFSSSVFAGVSYNGWAEYARSLDLNLDATDWFIGGGHGLNGRPMDDFATPMSFIYFCDGDGQSSAYVAPGYPGVIDNPEDWSSIAPVQRHGGKFNAGYLDGHAAPTTWAEGWKREYVLADPE
jgi:prepilin-type processing-associated H-X9-DG protein